MKPEDEEREQEGLHSYREADRGRGGTLKTDIIEEKFQGQKPGKRERERERCASYLDKSVKIAKQEQQSKSLKV